MGSLCDLESFVLKVFRYRSCNCINMILKVLQKSNRTFWWILNIFFIFENRLDSAVLWNLKEIAKCVIILAVITECVIWCAICWNIYNNDGIYISEKMCGRIAMMDQLKIENCLQFQLPIVIFIMLFSFFPRTNYAGNSIRKIFWIQYL